MRSDRRVTAQIQEPVVGAAKRHIAAANVAFPHKAAKTAPNIARNFL